MAVVTGLPVEVALATHATDAAMRRAWRDRQQGRATPLLVVHDAIGKPGMVRVIGPGPADERAAVREVPGDRLAELITGLANASRLTAARQLAEELTRLDEQGTPGLIVKGLLTRHMVTTRLREGEDWRWMTDAATGVRRESDWRTTLTALGYRLERRPRRGWLARADDAPVLVIHPTADPAEFTRLDRDGRPPEGVLAVDCAAVNVAYGVLASGTRLRLFRFTAEPGTPATTTTFLELDTAALRDQDWPLLGLLAPSSLRIGGHFARLVDEARRFGSALRDRLDVELRLRVLPELAGGAGSLGAFGGP